ncbi:DUF6711 family protein [Lederbergia wuyishanensis]|uniref:Phage protein n=1 Tax=Lederbergia wuyishanensis TaxID=1347903 RepID=A0ABU0D4I3_9BACI|nr:DUF6711 family protein [Lederbergia wuyishanensis]MCJ8008123.1 hypothetical protein [Lederbergia wuyishanensis]MDQ0343291.1 hypothetical protein [Lederbergia wuyishanensis]
MVFSINGVDMPAPSDLNIGIMDLSKAERNSRGTMIIERIATKRKLEVSYNYLSKDQLSQVLNSVSPVFISVKYSDPQTNGIRTGTFYCGDRSVGLIDYRNGVPRYKDIKFDLVER